MENANAQTVYDTLLPLVLQRAPRLSNINAKSWRVGAAMPNICKNTIRIIGTHEAVSEVAMFLCQGHRIEVADSPFRTEVTPGAALVHIGSEGTLQHLNRNGVIEEDGWSLHSFGIEMHSGPDESIRYILTADASSAWEAPSAALAALSRRFPDVVISVIYDESMNSVWGLDAYAAGDRFLRLEDSDFPVSDEWRAREAEADDDDAQRLYEEHDGRRNAGAIERLHAAAGEKLSQRQAARADSIPIELRSHGWPRWGVLAHAAHADGTDGLRIALHDFDSAEEMEVALVEEFQGARELGVASWMDTALFCDKSPVHEQELTIGGVPYAALSLEAYAPRQHDLLELLAQEHEADSIDARLARALLASLSHPEARLECGLHPAVFLTAAARTAAPGGAPSETVRAGLDLLLSNLAKKTPRLLGAESLGQPAAEGESCVPQNELLKSVMAIAAQPRAASNQLKPALAAGIPPTFLLHTLAARTAGLGFANPEQVNPGMVLESLKDAYGYVSRFPPELVCEIERVGSSMAASLEALRTAEMMETHISNAQPTAARSSPRRSPRL
jgi:hypothetical protein